MPLVDSLLNAAYQDTQLLLKNDKLGDVLSKSRDVEFLLRTQDKTRADTVCSFINDNQYGVAKVESDDEGFGILVTVNMPSTQQLLCSVSALMCCLSELFSVEYDGWGTTIQRAA
jgi:predicted RNA-binding protein (virulence factor B family)